MGGLEETVNVFRRQTALLALAFVIISDFEEEKHVESKATKKDEQVQQPIEVEQLVAFLVISVEARLLDIEANFLDIPVAIPTQSQSKYMMKHKGKKQVEEGNSPTKVTWKWTLVEIKEIQKIFQWIWMGSKEQQWARQVG